MKNNNDYQTTYKGYQLEKMNGEYITTIEDGMYTYSMLVEKHKTLKDARNEINSYIDRINRPYQN